ncbi:MAG: hypothetical protein EXR50_06850 [Dehalococcoidia bacterium]|nr:hypothetical protein [Dehalococcoidia bacterium]
MVRKRSGGFVFITYKGDHPPYHVHIEKDGREIGRWDIENQEPLDDFEVGAKLRKALKRLGYLVEDRDTWNR